MSLKGQVKGNESKCLCLDVSRSPTRGTRQAGKERKEGRPGCEGCRRGEGGAAVALGGKDGGRVGERQRRRRRREGASFCGRGCCCQIITRSLPAHAGRAGRRAGRGSVPCVSCCNITSFLSLGFVAKAPALPSFLYEGFRIVEAPMLRYKSGS